MPRYAVAPAKVTRNPSPIVRGHEAKPVRASATRVRLAAMGATPVTKNQEPKPEAGKQFRPLPRVSLGQLFRAAIVVGVACLVVAFPPPGLEKRSVAISVIDAADIVTDR